MTATAISITTHGTILFLYKAQEHEKTVEILQKNLFALYRALLTSQTDFLSVTRALENANHSRWKPSGVALLMARTADHEGAEVLLGASIASRLREVLQSSIRGEQGASQSFPLFLFRLSHILFFSLKSLCCEISVIQLALHGRAV